MGYRKNFKLGKPASIFSFLSFYLRFLFVFGIKFVDKRFRKRIRKILSEFDVSGFLRVFQQVYVNWRPFVNSFRRLVAVRRVNYSNKFFRYISFLGDIEQFSMYFFFFYYKVYLMRFRLSKFFRFFKFIVMRYIKQVSLYGIDIEFYGVDNETVTASFLSRYLSRKIEMRFNLTHHLFKPINKELKNLVLNTTFLGGYKLQFVGRMTRRGKVMRIVYRGGRIPVSSVAAQIDHSFSIGVMRNGVFCVRVWLFRYKNYGNYNYSSGYWLRLNS